MKQNPRDVCGVVFSLVVSACAPEIEQVDISGATMGTTYTVRVVADGVDESSLRQNTGAMLERIDAQMSTWRAESEISRFNRTRNTDWFGISGEFMAVLSGAREISRQTDGAFDVTLGKLVEAWGFGSSRSPARVPDPEMISAYLAHSGPDKLEIDPSRGAVRKIDPELQLDLSAIAKGFAVDAVAGVLARAGIEDFLVEIGGEVRASGKRLDGSSWQVAIEQPRTKNRSVQTVLPLRDAAIATSGDYRNYFELEGERYSHIIDPLTGSPPDHQVASVSVIADDAMTADALATALMVMGTGKALAHAAEHDLAVMVIERDGDQFLVHTSDRFRLLSSAE